MLDTNAPSDHAIKPPADLTSLLRAPVPRGTDLAHLAGFVLDARWVVDGVLWNAMPPAAAKATITLFAKAWRQVPTGSLPNIERVIAGFSGLAGDWLSNREYVLAGWRLYADGRLYHDDLSEWVCAALKRHKKYVADREADRKRLKAWRETRRETSCEAASETPDETDVKPVSHGVSSFLFSSTGIRDSIEGSMDERGKVIPLRDDDDWEETA